MVNPIEISGKDFILHASNTKPLPGFKYPKNEKTGEEFPNCCEVHKRLLKTVEDWFFEFPNCCDPHKEISKEKRFRKENYQNVRQKVLDQVIYTEYHIIERINADDWYEDITDYFEYNDFSTGRGTKGDTV